MSEMDPIVREALKRSSRMQGVIPQKPSQHNEVQKNNDKKETKQEVFHEKEDNCENQSKKENTLDLLLKDKDRSLIFLLIVLLMNENSDPALLMTLMYLLI